MPSLENITISSATEIVDCDFCISDELASGSISPKLTPKQKKVIDMLHSADTALLSELCEECGVTAAVVKNLEKCKHVI